MAPGHHWSIGNQNCSTYLSRRAAASQTKRPLPWGTLEVLLRAGSPPIKIAVLNDSAWASIAPKPGWRGYMRDERHIRVWDGTSWQRVSKAPGSLSEPNTWTDFQSFEVGFGLRTASGVRYWEASAFNTSMHVYQVSPGESAFFGCYDTRTLDKLGINFMIYGVVLLRSGYRVHDAGTSIVSASDGTLSLGASDKPFANDYGLLGTVSTSDARKKTPLVSRRRDYDGLV